MPPVFVGKAVDGAAAGGLAEAVAGVVVRAAVAGEDVAVRGFPPA